MDEFKTPRQLREEHNALVSRLEEIEDEIKHSSEDTNRVQSLKEEADDILQRLHGPVNLSKNA